MTSRLCNSAVCTCKIRVLVVDNNIEDRNDHVEDLTRWGFEPIAAQGVGDSLLADAKAKAHQMRCHVALVDMRLKDDADDNDHSGLNLVRDLKPTRSIVVTGHSTVPLNREARSKYGAFELFGKDEHPAGLHNTIRNVASDQCFHTLRIYPDSWLDQYVAPQLKGTNNIIIQAEEIRDTLAIMFPKAEEIVLAPLLGIEQTSSSVAGAFRRRSFVFSVVVDNHQPLLVKLATTNWDEPEFDKIKREVENYKQYVEEKLGGHHHAQLRYHKRLWNIGGVAYSFLGNNGKANVFSKFYLAHTSSKDILAPLNHFFMEVWRENYLTPRRMKGSLFESYDDIWDNGLTKQLNAYHRSGKRRPFSGVTGSFFEPWLWLKQNKDRSKLENLRVCVVHGDFHADNLFADDEGHSWIIDFERTGEGHILADFVELEQDVLTRLCSIETHDLRLFYELAIELTRPKRTIDELQLASAIELDPEAKKSFEVIRGLRKIAIDEIKLSFDYREYYWGLLLDALYVNAKLDNDRGNPRWEKTLLLASVICERLDRWDKGEWPSKEWSPVSSTSQTTKQNLHFDHGFSLLIGVGETPNIPMSDLPATVNDALEMHKSLVDPQCCGYLQDNVQVLTKANASLDRIRNQFHWLAQRCKNNSEATVVIYFSGHGIKSKDGQQFGLLPYDVSLDPKTNTLHNDSVLWADEFRQLIDQIQARRLLVLIDACHAEGTALIHKGDVSTNAIAGFQKSPLPDSLVSLLQQGEGRAILTSSREDQKSFIRRDRQMSIFTTHVIEALRGKNNHPSDKEVRVANLINHLGKTVAQSVQTQYQDLHDHPDIKRGQNPRAEFKHEDFPIALINGGKGL